MIDKEKVSSILVNMSSQSSFHQQELLDILVFGSITPNSCMLFLYRTAVADAGGMALFGCAIPMTAALPPSSSGSSQTGPFHFPFSFPNGLKSQELIIKVHVPAHIAGMLHAEVGRARRHAAVVSCILRQTRAVRCTWVVAPFDDGRLDFAFRHVFRSNLGLLQMCGRVGQMTCACGIAPTDRTLLEMSFQDITA